MRIVQIPKGGPRGRVHNYRMLKSSKSDVCNSAAGQCLGTDGHAPYASLTTGGFGADQIFQSLQAGHFENIQKLHIKFLWKWNVSINLLCLPG